MHALYDFCKTRGINTRVVESAIAIELSRDDGAYLEEYHRLGAAYEKLKDWSAAEQGKDGLIVEILLELYKKIAKIERKLFGEEELLQRLEKKDQIAALGHGVMYLRDGNLVEGQSYYLRFVLPVFSDRIIALFALALSDRVLQITKMHPSDIEDFDNYIANTEMANIRAQKYLRDQK
ncbi:hypothetical protein [Helicobacter mustelae]|uniref:Uncharacterized protein n=1 Tax=Helicobacter mustelae (strain ATCC 43772 / CCUG 25715 / CIP 103759 / LMG 18044 / NCTC 12198 / R85-136P) TaxID=679897 RepID=D3UJ06_HELM1|nr:hypothetical protein [Helicobacter mustelae]CBG40481.1 putative hypothetical protein [Helicobacter mustelae 12198]SQH71980.1 Uncharacterised protein [Helicobacter mustelae]STP13123.1 Uncharacterised protein [Helicobacter mustelae]